MAEESGKRCRLLLLACGGYLFRWGKALGEFSFSVDRIVELESRIFPAKDHKSAYDVSEYCAGKKSEGKCACRVMREKPTALAVHKPPKAPSGDSRNVAPKRCDEECTMVCQREAFLP